MIKISTCPICKKEFSSYNKGGDRGFTIYCSFECSRRGLIGKPSKLKGIKTGKTWNKGLTKDDHPSIMAYSKKKLGKKNPMWKGGIDGSSYAHRIAKKPEKEVCEICGSSAPLDVHHKDKNRKNNIPSNLIVVCRKCHSRDDWKNYKPKRVTVICEYCGKEKMIYPCEVKRFRYCSKSCVGKNMNKIRWKLI